MIKNNILIITGIFFFGVFLFELEKLVDELENKVDELENELEKIVEYK